MTGKFITFEGIDGAGKSTHIADALEQLRATGREVVSTREPGGTPIGEAIRALFLSQAMQAETELLLVFAARREHLETVIWPALARDAWVVCDRFTDATVAYQGFGRALGRARVDTLAQWTHPAFAPDLTLWFDVPPATAAARLATGRAEADRFEREQVAFFERVRAGYADIAAREPQRVVQIDSARALAQVRDAVRAAIGRLL